MTHVKMNIKWLCGIFLNLYYVIGEDGLLMLIKLGFTLFQMKTNIFILDIVISNAKTKETDLSRARSFTPALPLYVTSRTICPAASS